MKKIIIAMCIIAMAGSAKAQSWNDNAKRLVWSVLSGDPRVTVTPVSTSVNIGGYQEVALRVKNNFTPTLYVKMRLTVTDNCGKTLSHTFTYTLKNYETQGGDTWFEGFGVGGECKDSREIVKGERTKIARLEYELLEIRDLDAEKKAEDEKRLAEERKREQEKKRLEDERKAKAEEAQKQKEAEAKKKKEAEEAQKKKDAEAQKKKEQDEKAKNGDAATASKAAADGSSSSSGSGTAQMTEEEKQAKKQEEAEERQRQAEEQKRIEQEQKEAAAKAEQERLDKRQQEYDSWKSQKKEEQAQLESQATEASALFFLTIGAMVYKNMGNVNPDYIFQNFKEQTQFYTGFEFGFSATNYPMLFQSKYHTMVGGRDIYRDELIKVNAFTMNMDVKYKIGAEHPTYGGGYAYIYPKAGFSPIFDAFQLSPLTLGGHLNGGWKWIRGYVDYSSGSRSFTRTDYDPEESGEGASNFKFGKLQYGIQFTTKPNSDYKRSHISIGMIREKITPGPKGGAYANEYGTLYSSKSPAIKGYAFEWKKDHTFSWYINAYPKYYYTGETGGLSRSSDFNDKPTGVFFEMGFLRAVDWWINK